jgi:hypothetical protein
MALAGLVLAAFGTVAEPMAEAVGAQNDSQIPIDPQIAHEIAGIQAIDNHAHPVLAPPAMATDREFDALPADSLEPQTDPVALRPDYPLLGAAWKALYGFDTPPPLDAAGLAQLNALRAKVEADKGEHFPSWALDQAGIGTMLANRVALGYGIEPPRFRWVPFADALLFPLDNEGLAAATPDRKTFFPLEAIVRARYVKESGLSALPKTLDEYLNKVVTATLERHKAGGAVAEKFEVAYLRSFDFSDPPRAAAAKVYARWISCCRISCSVTSRRNADASGCPCTSTRSGASAATSPSPV